MIRSICDSVTITERVSNVAYRLQLPPESRVHPVFHVSLLRQAHGNPTTILLLVTNNEDDGVPIPAHILNHRHHNNQLQVLVSWKNKGLEDATWEPYEAFRYRSPEVCHQSNYPNLSSSSFPCSVEIGHLKVSCIMDSLFSQRAEGLL